MTSSLLAAEQRRDQLRGEAARLQSLLSELSFAKNMRAIQRSEFFERRAVIVANLCPVQKELSELNRLIKKRNQASGQGRTDALIAACYQYLLGEDDLGSLNEQGQTLMSEIEQNIHPNVLLKNKE